MLLKIFAVEIDGEEGSKSERVTNFLAVPRELEKVRFPLLSKIDPDASLTISVDQIIVFGSFVCLDSFLYTFTILPLRALVALKHLVSNIAFNESQARRTGRPRRRLRLSHKCDLTKAAILLGTLVILHHITDASKMYHGVRGQDTVKLYVLFNVLEVRILGSVLVGLVRSSQGSGVPDRRSVVLLVRPGSARLALLAAYVRAENGRHASASAAARPLWTQSRLRR